MTHADELAAVELRLRNATAQLEWLTRAWAVHELDALPRGPWEYWRTSGTLPRSLQPVLARLPEPVALLLRAHFADEMGDCQHCGRRAPCRLMGGESGDLGECRWRCAWGCASLREVSP